MNKLILCTTLTVIVATTAISVTIHRRVEARLRERTLLSQQQAGELARLSQENERLSNLASQLKNSRSLSADQLRELLKLRAEAGQLRQAGVEQKNLQAANEQLRATAAKSERAMAEARSAPNYWARDQLTFAGYGDPQSAVRSILWAVNNGQFASWRSMMAPEALAEMQREWKGKSEEQIAEEMKAAGQSLVAAEGFHVVDQREPAPGVAIVSLSFDGEGRIRKFVLHKIGTEWKFRDLLVEGQSEPEYPASGQTN